MKKISLPEQGLESLLGNLDENLRSLEEMFAVKISVRGGEFTIQGSPAQERRAGELLRQLGQLLQDGHTFRRGDVALAARLFRRNEGVSLKEYFVNHRVQTSATRSVYPRSANQAAYIDAIRDGEMVFAIGPAGTGKTFLAMAMAVEFLIEGRVDRIVLTRPAVEAGEKLGFLPGDLAEKVNPYLRPLYDSLYRLVEREKAEGFLTKGLIEIAPLAFMRGRTLSQSFVILDEAQNCSSEQMKMLLTRIGFDTRTVVTGDITQIDLPPGKVSGLVEAQTVVGPVPGIRFIYFDENDVARHPLVREIITAYERHGQGEPEAPEETAGTHGREPVIEHDG
jgi:phosphate starvation-inducible PhoH-like protein